jgi:radical SAM superfamily enzyme YgiQ (UPF0313 family)
MNVLCILPRFNVSDIHYYDPQSTEKFYRYILPTGIPFVSAAIRKAGYPVDFQNQNNLNGLVRDIVREQLTKKHYDVIFTGGVSMYYPNIKDIINYVREISPDTKIVAGGGIISSQPEIMLGLLKPDYGIIFEGEETSVELLRCLERGEDPSVVRGLVFEKDGKPYLTQPRQPIERLDDLPYPDWDAFGLDDYLDNQIPFHMGFGAEDWLRPYSIIASRGCPFHCTFCYHTTGPKYRTRSIENVIEELRWAIKRYRVNYIFILDELLSSDKPRALKLFSELNKITESTQYPLRIYMGGMRVNCVDEDIADGLAGIKNALVIATLGIESYSQPVLTSMKKGITPKDIKRCLTLLADRNLMAQGSFIFGDPAETLETAKETCKFYMERQDIIRGCIDIGFIIPFAGTEVYRYCIENSLIKDEIQLITERANGYSMMNPINMTQLSQTDFIKLQDMVWTTEYLANRFSFAIGERVVNGVWEVDTKCPFCGEVTILKHTRLPKEKFVNLLCICSHCNARFRLVSGWHYLNRLVVKMVGFNAAVKLKNLFCGEVL